MVEPSEQPDVRADDAVRWPMTCPCGEEWPRECWPELPPIGRYLAGRDGWIELRRCVCGATLAVNDADLDAE